MSVIGNRANADPNYAQFVEYSLQPDRDFESKFERWRDHRKKQ